jgi:hypothetical protein
LGRSFISRPWGSLYVGDPVSGNGMAAMTNGDKGEEVCNALCQRVATAYGWR